MTTETPHWIREFRAALKAQSRDAVARLKATMGDKTPEEQERAVSAILAATLPRKR